MIYKGHLETPRIATRFLTQDDVAAWMEYCNDPIATTFTSFPHKKTLLKWHNTVSTCH